MARGERAYSVIELTVAAGLFFIVLAGVLAVFAAQSRLEWIGRGQYDIQAAANRVLDDLVEGERRTWFGATVRGLRYATATAVSPDGVCFLTRDHLVTYYRESSTLCRLVEPPGPLAVKTSGGAIVLRDVIAFSALPEIHAITYPDGTPDQALTVTIQLSVRKDTEQDIVLTTRVRLRNWSPGP